MRTQLLYFALSGTALLAMIWLMTSLAGQLGIDESLFFRGAPVLAPFLSTAVIVLLMTGGLGTRSSNGIRMLGACSFFFILLAAGSMALGGMMVVLGQSRLSNNALAFSCLTGLIASGLVLVHWSAAGLSMLRPGQSKNGR